MNFLEALQADENTAAVDGLTTALRSDEVPFQVRNNAQKIAAQMELVDETLNEFRSEAALIPNYFQDRAYSAEGATELQTAANLRVIRAHNPSGAIDRLETLVKSFLSNLADRSKPLPPTTDPALLEALLLGARQDARDALSGVQVNLPEAILNLQAEALANGEDSLGYLLGATPWAARYVKANSDLETQLDFDKIAGVLRDNVSDADAQPYRLASERLAELDDVPSGYRASWKVTLEESGLLIPEVATALGLD